MLNHPRIAGKPLEIDAVLDLGIQIADALDAAHSKGTPTSPNLLLRLGERSGSGIMAKFSGCVLVPVRCKNGSKVQLTNFDMRTLVVAVAWGVRTLEDKPIF